MNELLKYPINSLSNLTKSLKKISLLLDKPWALVDENGQIQKLIFKKNKELILSQNGSVNIGSWDYYPEARSLLIDRLTDKLLLNEVFIDENVIIMKKDGTNTNFFALANENTLPDYNIVKYLNGLKYDGIQIKRIDLYSGDYINVLINPKISYELINSNVERTDENLNAYDVPDGKYLSKDKRYTYRLSSGKIVEILNNIKLESKSGEEFIIHGADPYYSSYPQYLNKEISENGKKISVNIIETKQNMQLIISDSIITAIRFLRTYQLSNGALITIEQKDSGYIKKGDIITTLDQKKPLLNGKFRIKGRLKWIKVKDSKVI